MQGKSYFICFHKKEKKWNKRFWGKHSFVQTAFCYLRSFVWVHQAISSPRIFECSQPWHFIINFCIGKCKLLWHLEIKYFLEAWVIWGQFTWENAFWWIKKVKNCWKNMKKRIPNFSSLGLQDLYENNQIYSEFLGDVLMKKLNNFVMCCLWAHCVNSGVLLWKWKRTLWMKGKMCWCLSTPHENGRINWFEFSLLFSCSRFPLLILPNQ